MHFEVVSASATAPGAGAAATALAGDSLIIKNARSSAGADIIAAWMTNQTAGFGQIAFPSGHDTTRGFRSGNGAGVNPAWLPLSMKIPVTPQELMNITIAGSAVAGDVEQLSMLVRYGDLPGVTQRLISPNEVMSRMEKMTTIEQTVTTTAGPGYSGEALINSVSDLLLANRDYAVLGMSSRTAVHNITLRGPDLGNVRIAVPGVLRQELTSQWFMMLSNALGEKLVPVINSGNKAATFLGGSTDENAAAFIATVFLALLK